MKVIKNINNNVAICVDDNGHEVVAMGKGIGFSKPPYEVDLSKIDRTYYSLDSHYVTLLSEIPEEVIDVTLEIVEKGSDYLGVNLSRTFWFSLCDHINFAIENVKNGLVISNPMTNEIKHLYEKEMLLLEAEAKEQYYQELEKSSREVRKIKHDLKNMLLAICGKAKKQNEILKEQNDKLQKQLTDAQNIISSSKEAYELNNQVISDAQEIILKQSEYIEKLKDELSHDGEQTSEKKGFFSRLFGL